MCHERQQHLRGHDNLRDNFGVLQAVHSSRTGDASLSTLVCARKSRYRLSMSIRPIVLYPAPVLLTETTPVAMVDQALRALVADMVDTMHAAPGIGLAANQVGDSRRVCVIDLSVGENIGELLILINPIILDRFGATEVAEEGCLSFPDILIDVERTSQVRVRALDIDSNSRVIEADGLLARVIQHECEHLDGRTFLSNLSSLKRELVKKRIRKRIRNGDWSEAGER